MAVDCTKEVIEEASNLGCEMIITHHPLFFRKPNSIVKGDFIGDKVLKLIKEDINLYSCHTNLDSEQNGINEKIVNMLGYKSDAIMEQIRRKDYENLSLIHILIFQKGTNLYGLNFAVKNKLEEDYIIIVEGYMDLISLHQHGITNTVASLGTALTVNQARLLKRYVSKVIISYDADVAGQTATLRGLEILRNTGFDVKDVYKRQILY